MTTTTTGAVVQQMDYDEFGRVLVDNTAPLIFGGFAGALILASPACSRCCVA